MSLLGTGVVGLVAPLLHTLNIVGATPSSAPPPASTASTRGRPLALARPTPARWPGPSSPAARHGAPGGMYAGPTFTWTPPNVLMLASGSAWGVWLGIWTAATVDELGDPRPPVRARRRHHALLTDLCLTLTAFAISELVDLEPLRYAWISLAAASPCLLGVTTSMLAAGVYAPGLSFGTLGGLTLGTVLTQFVDLPGMGADYRAPEPLAPEGQPDAFLFAIASLAAGRWRRGSGGAGCCGGRRAPAECSLLLTVTGSLQVSQATDRPRTGG